MVPDALRLPQPEAGLRLQVTPAFVLSLVTDAVRVTGGLPASITVAVPEWAALTVMALFPLLPVPPPPQPTYNPIAKTENKRTRTLCAVTAMVLSAFMVVPPPKLWSGHCLDCGGNGRSPYQPSFAPKDKNRARPKAHLSPSGKVAPLIGHAPAGRHRTKPSSGRLPTSDRAIRKFEWNPRP